MVGRAGEQPALAACSCMVAQPNARVIFQVLIVVAIVLLGLAVRPFLEALFLAAVLSGALLPLQRRLTRKLWGRRVLAAGLISFAVIAAVLAPAIGFGAAVVRDLIAAARSVTAMLQQEGVMGVVDGFPPPLAGAVHYALDRLPMQDGRPAARGLDRRGLASEGSVVDSEKLPVSTPHGVRGARRVSSTCGGCGGTDSRHEACDDLQRHEATMKLGRALASGVVGTGAMSLPKRRVAERREGAACAQPQEWRISCFHAESSARA